MPKIKLTENFLAQSSHVAWGFLFLSLPVIFTRSFVVMWWSFGILVVLEAAKEWLDCHGLEDEYDSGGPAGSWEDFSFWFLGNAIAVSVFMAARHLGNF